MRRIQKYLSGLCAAALLLSLLLAGTAKADEITIYLMAENDQMLDLPLSAMPAWINGDIYVPYTAFDWTVTGVNLGVSYGQERTETEYKFTLYSLNGMLVFDLNAGTCTDGFSGEAKDMRAALRNGRVFDDALRLYVGGGITPLSDPETEWQETCQKADTLLNLIRQMNYGKITF